MPAQGRRGSVFAIPFKEAPAAAELPQQFFSPFQIGSPDTPTQAAAGLVGERDGVSIIASAGDLGDRTEDFVIKYRHPRIHAIGASSQRPKKDKVNFMVHPGIGSFPSMLVSIDENGFLKIEAHA